MKMVDWTFFKTTNPEKNGWKDFFTSCPELSIWTTVQVGKERVLIYPEKVEKWFRDFQKYKLIEEVVGDKDFLSDPSRIYNADESGIHFV